MTSHANDPTHEDADRWQYRADCDCTECVRYGKKIRDPAYQHQLAEEHRNVTRYGYPSWDPWGVND